MPPAVYSSRAVGRLPSARPRTNAETAESCRSARARSLSPPVLGGPQATSHSPTRNQQRGIRPSSAWQYSAAPLAIRPRRAPGLVQSGEAHGGVQMRGPAPTDPARPADRPPALVAGAAGTPDGRPALPPPDATLDDPAYRDALAWLYGLSGVPRAAAAIRADQ